MKIEQREIPQAARVETAYISDDGERFDNADYCWLHEKDLTMEKENRIQPLDSYWYLFNDQSELNEYCEKSRAYKVEIEKRGGKFPIWIRFEYCYFDNQWEEYYTIPLLKDDYADICKLKKMIEDTQL